MVVMGVLSSWEMLATNSLRLASDFGKESAMALKASASSPTSSFRLAALHPHLILPVAEFAGGVGHLLLRGWSAAGR